MSEPIRYSTYITYVNESNEPISKAHQWLPSFEHIRYAQEDDIVYYRSNQRLIYDLSTDSFFQELTLMESE